MNEPYVLSTVYDMSGGLLPAPADDGFNVVLPVYTPAGPVEKTKVLSQKDFLDRFMAGNTIQPTDHFSAIFNYTLLGSTPTYVVRACPVSILEGVGSTGARYLFDKDFNLLSSYNKFRFNIRPTSDSYTIGYYTGNDLDNLVDSLVEQDSARDYPLSILYTEDGQIVSRSKLNASSNVGIFDESVQDSVYYTLGFNSGVSLNVTDYVSINGNSWEYLASEGDAPSDTLTNGVNYHSSNSDAMLFGLFLLGKTNLTNFCNQVSLGLSKANSGNITNVLTVSSTIPGIVADDDAKSFKLTSNKALSTGSVGSLKDKYTETYCEGAWTEGESTFAHGVVGAKVGDLYLNYDNSTNLPSWVATVIDPNRGTSKIDNIAPTYCANFEYVDSESENNFYYDTDDQGNVLDFSVGKKARGDLADREATIEESGDAVTLVLCLKPESTQSFKEVVISTKDSHDNFNYNILLADGTVSSTWGWSNKAPINPSSTWDNFSSDSDECDAVYFYTTSEGARRCRLGQVQQGCFKPQVSIAPAVDADAAYLEVKCTSTDRTDLSVPVTTIKIYRFYLSSESVADTAFPSGGLCIYNHIYSPVNSAAFLSYVARFFIDNSSAQDEGVEGYSITPSGKITLYVSRDGSAVAGNVNNGETSTIVFGDDSLNQNIKTYTYEVSNNSNNDIYIKYESIWAIVGDYFYYTKSSRANDDFLSYAGTKTQVKMSSAAVSASEFNELLQRHLFQTQNVSMYNGYFISTAVDEYSSEPTDSSYEVTIVHDFVEQNPSDVFAFVPKFPCTTNLFKFSYKRSEDNEDIIELSFNYKDGTTTQDWTMSFVPGVVDSYGVDMWFTRVNANNNYFQIVSLQGSEGRMFDSWTSSNFGSAVNVPPFHAQWMQNAIDDVPNYEDDIHYDVVSDGGVADTSLARNVNKVAKDLYAVYPASLPSETTNPQDIISFVGGASLHIEGNWEVRMLSAGDRINVSGFSVVMPGSYKLILQQLAAFRNPGTEFAANFGLNHGTVPVSNLVQFWKKPDRELLLDYGVETLKGGTTTAYYINDNITAQSNKSYMSEDQNVRMTNRAVHLIDDFSKQFLGEFNIAKTRRNVEEGGNSLLQERLFKGRSYTPASYSVVCDSSNNTLDVVNRNDLVIDLYAQFTPSIKRVLVKHYIIPLSEVQ